MIAYGFDAKNYLLGDYMVLIHQYGWDEEDEINRSVYSQLFRDGGGTMPWHNVWGLLEAIKMKLSEPSEEVD